MGDCVCGLVGAMSVGASVGDKVCSGIVGALVGEKVVGILLGAFVGGEGPSMMVNVTI
jgi:hypothetical protein